MENQESRDVGIKVEGGLSERLSNFWYHYKWHTIAAVFVIVVLSVCIAQCAGNTSYDIQVLYAGNHSFSRTSDDGGYPEYATMVSTLAGFAKDSDGNGQTSVSFLDLYLLTKDEYNELESDPDRGTPSLSLIQENTSMLENNMTLSDYYVCLLSERLFLQYSEGDANLGRFVKLSGYAPEGSSYDYVSEYGIRLSSLGIKDLPGFDLLDAEDTIVCLRNVSAASSMFNKAESREQLSRAEDMMREMLAYSSEE